MDDLLTRSQKRVIPYLLSQSTIVDAACEARVGYRTIVRWLAEDNAFQKALAQAEGRAIDAATRHLVSMAEDAVSTLQSILKSSDTTDSVRLRAAQAVLDHLLKLRELRNVEQRLTELERRVFYGD